MSTRRSILFSLMSFCYGLHAYGQHLPLRQFPPSARYGTLLLESLAQATINSKPLQVSPGLRIFNPQNMMILGNQIAGVPLEVAYRLDTNGMLQEVWILTPAEIENNKDAFPKGWTFKFW